MPAPASASAVRAYCRRSFHSEPAMQATPTTVPSTTRSQGGTSPCSTEYLKKRSPASASATPPRPAAARTPKSCSQSISTRGPATGGGAAGRGGAAGGGGGAAGRAGNGGAAGGATACGAAGSRTGAGSGFSARSGAASRAWSRARSCRTSRSRAATRSVSEPPAAVRERATTARTSAVTQTSPSMPPVSSPPRLDQALRVHVGVRERLERARHAVHADPSRDQRRDRDAPFGDRGERARELLRRVAEHELQRQLLVDAVHGTDAIVLHADAGDHDARLARRVAHELVEEPGHADALEEDGGTRTGGGLPGIDRALPRRIDGHVRPHPLGERAPRGREVGRHDGLGAAQPEGRDLTPCPEARSLLDPRGAGAANGGDPRRIEG